MHSGLGLGQRPGLVTVTVRSRFRHWFGSGVGPGSVLDPGYVLIPFQVSVRFWPRPGSVSALPAAGLDR